jgi:hypothetical protein
MCSVPTRSGGRGPRAPPVAGATVPDTAVPLDADQSDTRAWRRRQAALLGGEERVLIRPTSPSRQADGDRSGRGSEAGGAGRAPRRQKKIFEIGRAASDFWAASM